MYISLIYLLLHTTQSTFHAYSKNHFEMINCKKECVCRLSLRCSFKFFLCVWLWESQRLYEFWLIVLLCTYQMVKYYCFCFPVMLRLFWISPHPCWRKKKSGKFKLFWKIFWNFGNNTIWQEQWVTICLKDLLLPF